LVGEVGRPARPRVVRVGDFPVVEVSHRASRVRVITWSRRSVHGFGSFYLRGRSLWHGFLRGLSFLVVEYGYPLFRHSTVAPKPLCECGHSCRGSVSHELESQRRSSSGGCVRAHPLGVAPEASVECFDSSEVFSALYRGVLPCLSPRGVLGPLLFGG
jgi:hypothetical protein